jgi:hypothetical protein
MSRKSLLINSKNRHDILVSSYSQAEHDESFASLERRENVEPKYIQKPFESKSAVLVIQSYSQRVHVQ